MAGLSSSIATELILSFCAFSDMESPFARIYRDPNKKSTADMIKEFEREYYPFYRVGFASFKSSRCTRIQTLD
ncbi:hypothetical protein D3C87_1805150 [compost metagenome]